VEYQRIAAAWFMPCLVRMLCVSWNGGVWFGWLVFGTLLGPEATGPVGWAAAYGLWRVCPGLFVSGFLAAPIMHGKCVWGVWFGVVV
jgi:hypothetical protein